MVSRRRLELEISLCEFLERKRGAVQHETSDNGDEHLSR